MAFDVYVMILCVFVMVTLVAFFSILIANIVCLRIKMIGAGLLDDEIEKEFANKKKQNIVFVIIFKFILPILFCILVFIAFVFSLYVKTNENSCKNNFCIPKVVRSNSMSYKNEKNKYLEFNNLKNQFSRFDIIFLDSMPKQEDLQVYDIVAYETNGTLIIHRIVGKQEKDGEILYLFRGDANVYNDYQYVKYSQMRGVYNGKKIAFVGSAVLFLQSPAGWMCIIMCVFVAIALPFVDKKIEKTIKNRLSVFAPHIYAELEKRSESNSSSANFQSKNKDKAKKLRGKNNFDKIQKTLTKTENEENDDE